MIEVNLTDTYQEMLDKVEASGEPWVQHSPYESFNHHYVAMGIDGQIVERTKQEYPYSYDDFVVWERGYQKGHSCVYSDRMMQWDMQKFRECCIKAFGNEGQMFYNREPQKIEQFLCLYLEKEVWLTAIVEGCNASSGYPIWTFFYTKERPKR